MVAGGETTGIVTTAIARPGKGAGQTIGNTIITGLASLPGRGNIRRLSGGFTTGYHPSRLRR